MWRQILIVCAVCVGIGGQPSGQQTAAPTADHKRLGEIIAKVEGPYTKVADGVWTTPYRGKVLQSITVRVAAAQGGIFFFVDLFERKSITLSRALLVKIAELNSQFDYVKIALSDDALLLRLDVRAKLMDPEEFKAMESQAASAADEAYAIIKDFVQ
jgi:hypothetical protein